MITSHPVTAPVAATARAGVVLDTNVVLDWLAFEDPSTAALAARIAAGDWQWLGTAAMREELADVLGRPAFRRFDATAVLAAWDSRVTLHSEPAVGALRCADPDDQVFIDLALENRAAWLLTRDRALLDLARQAATSGLRILRPIDLDTVPDPLPGGVSSPALASAGANAGTP